MNLTMLIGFLGENPAIEEQNGKTVARFSLATKSRFAGRDGMTQEATDWHSIVAFGGLANACRRLSKGDRVAVVGRLRSPDRRNASEVFASDIEFLVLRADRANG